VPYFRGSADTGQLFADSRACHQHTGRLIDDFAEADKDMRINIKNAIKNASSPTSFSVPFS
jgi:hypothetical protein